MKRTRRTEIIVETDEIVVIRRSRAEALIWCQECADPVRMITLDEALALAGVTSRTVHRWAEAGRIHYLETPSGCLLICLDSLSKLALELSEA